MPEVPESDEVRAERRKRFDFDFDINGQRDRLADWLDNLDMERAVKYYLTALLVLMVIGASCRGVAKIIEFAMKGKEDKNG